MITGVYTAYPVNEPTILTDPYKGSHVLRWSRSRGKPDSARHGLTTSREASFTITNEDEDLVQVTPYRLPRISPRDQSPQPEADGAFDRKSSDETDKVWSRYGYEKIIRIPQLGPQVKVLVPPPKAYLQQYRRTNVASAPRFKNAAITPSVRSLPWNVGRDLDEVQAYRKMYENPPGKGAEKSMLELCKECQRKKDQLKTPRSILRSSRKTREQDELSARSPRLEPTPTPVSRSESPAKSVKSIHWILGHNRYHTFDKKGRSRIQGPFSREFQVTCMAPNNWLRMKWGRSKTMVN